MSARVSIDTNVLVRLLVNDDASQQALAQAALTRYARQAQSVWVPVTVMLELDWVLRSRYQLAKAEVVRTFHALLATMELDFQAEEALEQALASYEDGAADFADCLHLALSRKAEALPFLTFDTKVSRLDGACLLSS